jgi:hypothetical protein
MIKPGKECSQLMKANDTVETNIKVVGKYFRPTFIFNALKTSLNLYLNSLISLILFFIFEIRGVLSIIACLEGGNLVNLIILLTQNQHPAPSTHQAERRWLSTRAESKVCQSIFLKLTKDEKQLDKNLELAEWYQTVPYLQPKSQVERHIATKIYLSADWISFGSFKT